MMDLTASEAPAEDFCKRWIASSIDGLRAECGGWPETLLMPAQAIWLFQQLIGGGAFPVSLVAASGPLPVEWPVVPTAVRAAYASTGKRKASAKSTDIKYTIYTAAGSAHYGADSSAKRLKGSAEGHPDCAQAEDCVGNSESTPMFRHIDGADGTDGDLYCATCWAEFSSLDPSLTAIPAT